MATSNPTNKDTLKQNLNNNSSGANSFYNSHSTSQPGPPALNTASLIEATNLILLTEFFKAVGNGELEKLKQILLNVDEINSSLKDTNNPPAGHNHKKLTSSFSHSNVNGCPPISMTKCELLNAGMVDADGLTALSIAVSEINRSLNHQ